MTENKTAKKHPGHNFTGPGPGRPKGMPNKFTTLKNAFIEAFDRTGGTDGLVEWIDKSSRNREAFYNWITKLFPHEVALSGSESGKELVLKVIHTGANGKGNGKGNGNGDGGKE